MSDNIKVLPYEYVAAWELIGGVAVAEHSSPQSIYKSEKEYFFLTLDPDTALERSDHHRAIANIALRHIFQNEQIDDTEVEALKVVQEIRASRAPKNSKRTFLIGHLTGTATVDLSKAKKDKWYTLGFGLADTAAITSSHKKQIESIITALSLKSGIAVKKISNNVSFLGEDGQPILNFSMSAQGRAYISTGLTQEEIGKISEDYIAIVSDSKLRSVVRLFGKMVENDEDPIRSFISGWAALEILIGKIFVELEDEFLSPLLAGSQTTLRNKFVARVKDVMTDKYRLSEKFTCVAAIIFASADESETTKDTNNFKRIKDVRDDLLHGKDIAEVTLPVNELSILVRKFIDAYIKFRRSRVIERP